MTTTETTTCCTDAGKPQKKHRENPDCPYAAIARHCVGDRRTPDMIRRGVTLAEYRAAMAGEEL